MSDTAQMLAALDHMEGVLSRRRGSAAPPPQSVDAGGPIDLEGSAGRLDMPERAPVPASRLEESTDKRASVMNELNALDALLPPKRRSSSMLLTRGPQPPDAQDTPTPPPALSATVPDMEIKSEAPAATTPNTGRVPPPLRPKPTMSPRPASVIGVSTTPQRVSATASPNPSGNPGFPPDTGSASRARPAVAPKPVLTPNTSPGKRTTVTPRVTPVPAVPLSEVNGGGGISFEDRFASYERELKSLRDQVDSLQQQRAGLIKENTSLQQQLKASESERDWFRRGGGDRPQLSAATTPLTTPRTAEAARTASEKRATMLSQLEELEASMPAVARSRSSSIVARSNPMLAGSGPVSSSLPPTTPTTGGGGSGASPGMTRSPSETTFRRRAGTQI